MISQPEDYGLRVEQTLDHRSSGDPPPRFETYWRQMREAAAAMPRTFQGNLDPGMNQLTFRSLKDVHIKAWLHMPPTSPRGVVLQTHAPDGNPDERQAQRWHEKSLAWCQLRVRGFEPSTIEVPQLGETWITHNIESIDDWILPAAVVDVMTVIRCLRHALPDLPLVLEGRSLGGGLAVIAASQLAAMDEALPGDASADAVSPERLILSLPSLGDWRWRSNRYCRGMGQRVNMSLQLARAEAPQQLESICLLDAALHARSLAIPTLCLLAERDDCVPAPSAAAVFNGLAGPKWRFLTTFGHYEGGLANARRHASFDRLASVFADPATSLENFSVVPPD